MIEEMSAESEWLDELCCSTADTAYSCDPRIKKFKEEEKARKESEKKAKADAKKREQEEKERVSLILSRTPADVMCPLDPHLPVLWNVGNLELDVLGEWRVDALVKVGLRKQVV